MIDFTYGSMYRQFIAHISFIHSCKFNYNVLADVFYCYAHLDNIEGEIGLLTYIQSTRHGSLIGAYNSTCCLS